MVAGSGGAVDPTPARRRTERQHDVIVSRVGRQQCIYVCTIKRLLYQLYYPVCMYSM